MTEWSKLKVPELKAELKSRGLPQTGLKAELVARLTTADLESGFESETTIKGDCQESTVNTGTPADQIVDSNTALTESQSEARPVANTQANENNNALAESGDHSRPVDEVLPIEYQTDASPNEAVEQPNPSPPEEATTSALPTVDSQEALEDKQKRKRRSQSPLPSASDVRRKRARPDDEHLTNNDNGERMQEASTSAADAEWVEKNNGVDATAGKVLRDTIHPPVAAPKEEIIVEPLEPAQNVAQGPTSTEEREPSEIVTGQERDPVAAPPVDGPDRIRDSRFKDLFTAQSGRPTQDQTVDRSLAITDPAEGMDVDPIDRSVGPSTHPATTALYIRDLQRPLNPVSLKEHLTILATSAGNNPDPDTIVDFYLDPIRSHAFVSFNSVSDASRVRSELHDRIWPEERTRKPLWVDFIPSEKILVWINEEQSSPSGSRSIGKKWEVVYNTSDDREVVAVLQEAGTPGGPVRKPSNAASAAPLAVSRTGMDNAPSGPRVREIVEQRAVSSLVTLDQLFRSTTAKPVLYYQPVSKEIVDKRLDHIEDATSKKYSLRTAGPEINRYTFEDGDVLVDRGPEIFPGIRPPPGYRGGRGGRGGGRGGYRDRGGDRYEGRRDPRDRGPRDRRY